MAFELQRERKRDEVREYILIVVNKVIYQTNYLYKNSSAFLINYHTMAFFTFLDFRHENNSIPREDN